MGNETLLAWGTVVLAAATLVLVGITYWYAKSTRRIVKEMEAGRKLAAMPVVTCELRTNEDRSAREGAMAGQAFIHGEFNDVILENAGNAPAINTIVQLDLINAEESPLIMQSTTWMVGSLGVGKWPRPLPTERAQMKLASANPRVSIKISYQNIYGIKFETDIIFEMQVRTVRPGDVHSKGVWVKRSENTTQIS